jgi:hypothetical protein
MILHGMAGERFELGIVGYQFDDAGEEHDRNWLVVRVAAEAGHSQWGGPDPCLLTWEAQELASWLHALARGDADVSPGLDFLEPELSFEVVGHAEDAVDLRIGTRHRLADGAGVADRHRDSVGVSVKVSRTQLRGAAEDLAAELARWPKR